MAVEATAAVTPQVATTAVAPKPAEVKPAEAKQPEATAQAPVAGDSVAKATPTEVQGKNVDVTV